jgi:hypothetical protein
MTKAIFSFGVGPLATFARLTRPSMSRYAERHGYVQAFDMVPPLDPPSWAKVPLLRSMLDRFDAVLWMDADCLVVDDSEDIAAEVPEGMAQALVAHVTHEGRVPNCGVWYLTREARPLLDEVMGLYEQFLHHPWWEQGAMISRLPHGWDQKTHWLDPGWNRERHDTQPTGRVRIEHFAGGGGVIGERLMLLRQRLAP